MKNLVTALTKHPFFHGFPEEYLPRISANGKILKFDAGDTLFQEGEEANKFYLVVNGKVDIKAFVPTKGSVTIQTAEDGEMLGWSWLAAPYKYKFSAKALTKTEVIVINGAGLRHQCETDERLGYELLKRIVGAVTARLEQTRLVVLDIYGKSLK